MVKLYTKDEITQELFFYAHKIRCWPWASAEAFDREMKKEAARLYEWSEERYKKMRAQEHRAWFDPTATEEFEK